MRGEHVVGARGGWDTHGFPVEIEVEKELGFRGKPDIEAYGIAEFEIWTWRNPCGRTSRTGTDDRAHRALDRHGAPVPPSMTTSYIQLARWIPEDPVGPRALFRDDKVTMHCPRRGPSLSTTSSRWFQDDVDDLSARARFRHRPERAPARHPWPAPPSWPGRRRPGRCRRTRLWRSSRGSPYVPVAVPGRRGGGAPGAGRAAGDGGSGARAFEDPGEARWRAARRRCADEPAVHGDARVSETGTAGYRRPGRRGPTFASLKDGTGIVHIAPAYGDLGHRPEVLAAPTRPSVHWRAARCQPWRCSASAGSALQGGRPADHSADLRDRGFLFRS